MTKAEILKFVYPTPEGFRGRRFTQDTPILPDVWIAYATAEPGASQELLLTPHAKSSLQELVKELRARLKAERGEEPFVAYNESHVLVDVTFAELIRAVLPLSGWWRRTLETPDEHKEILIDDLGKKLDALAKSPNLPELLFHPAAMNANEAAQRMSDVLDMIRITGAVLLGRPLHDGAKREADLRAIVRKVRDLMVQGSLPRRTEKTIPPLYSVSCNRTAETAVSSSRLAIKADAAIRLFDLSCKDMIWAVIDSGVDVNHPAFTNWPSDDPQADNSDCESQPSRILCSYDFTLLMPLQRFALRPEDPAIPERARTKFQALKDSGVDVDEITSDLKERLRDGRPIEWERLKPLLELNPKSDEINPPAPHGTHVAGILGADWRKVETIPKHLPNYRQPPDDPVIGVCPDIRIYDLRVIGDKGGSEFGILAALQFVRYLNMNRDKMVIHGVNLSFSLQHNVKSYACGSTPVCQECERLVNSGVVVVAAAGNRGYTPDTDLFESYRSMTITDPGNAEEVITVGATHRLEPHRYGVSYFSSRGPTGDGRMKPDLVAPGEKITSCVPGPSAADLDGTSMAAPHVSGAAALLMARHKELIGRPRKVKEVLCRTATDLGRERAFQGAGLLDVLRAIQSV